MGSSSFSGKPVMLVVASLSGAKALASPLDTLLVIEARVRPETTIHIPFASSKVNADTIITDDQVSGSLKQALHELLGT